MTVIGYARVSTADQDLSIQEAALRAAGCDVIRAEKQSGTSTQRRAELRTVLDFIGKGDVLLVTRVDRLARSIGDLQDIVRALKTKGASLKATEQPRAVSASTRSPTKSTLASSSGSGVRRRHDAGQALPRSRANAPFCVNNAGEIGGDFNIALSQGPYAGTPQFAGEPEELADCLLTGACVQMGPCRARQYCRASRWRPRILFAGRSRPWTMAADCNDANVGTLIEQMS